MAGCSRLLGGSVGELSCEERSRVSADAQRMGMGRVGCGAGLSVVRWGVGQ